MRRCPICKKRLESAPETRWAPFCCERCKIIDLGSWLSEGYRIPAESGVPDEDSDDRERT